MADLTRISLLQGLDAAQLAKFDSLSETISVEAHQTIYRIGDVTSQMFLVLSGRVRVFIRDRYGNPIIIAHLQTGELLGEPLFESKETCTSTAIALKKTLLLRLDRQNLTYLMSVKPDVVLDIITTLEHRLKQAYKLLSRTVPKK